jgi:hypothetical protein
MPDTVNMFWHGADLSPIDKICIQSFLDHGHIVRLFTYRAIETPPGVIVEEASAILPYDRFFTYANSPSAFSNIFRYNLLFERGGWWVDTDVLCLRTELPRCDYYWAEQDPGFINGAILKFPPGHHLCHELLKQSEERSKNIRGWGYLGPYLLTKILADYKPEGLSGSTSDAYPVSWREAHFFWLPEYCSRIETRIKSSSFIHLWNSIFMRMGISPSVVPPLGSFLRRFYDDLGFRYDTMLDIETCREAAAGFLKPYLETYPVRTD